MYANYPAVNIHNESDEQYVVQKPMWNVVRTLNKTKLCSKYQKKVEYKTYRENIT